MAKKLATKNKKELLEKIKNLIIAFEELEDDFEKLKNFENEFEDLIDTFESIRFGCSDVWYNLKNIEESPEFEKLANLEE